MDTHLKVQAGLLLWVIINTLFLVLVRVLVKDSLLKIKGRTWKEIQDDAMFIVFLWMWWPVALICVVIDKAVSDYKERRAKKRGDNYENY